MIALTNYFLFLRLRPKILLEGSYLPIRQGTSSALSLRVQLDFLAVVVRILQMSCAAMRHLLRLIIIVYSYMAFVLVVFPLNLMIAVEFKKLYIEFS